MDAEAADRILARKLQDPPDGEGVSQHRVWQTLSDALGDCMRAAPQKPRDTHEQEWGEIGRMVAIRNACTDAAERRALTRELARTRRSLKRKRDSETLRKGLPPPQGMRKHTPLADEERNPLIGPVATMRTFHNHYEDKYGGGTDLVKTALHKVVSETRAAARGVQGGHPLTFGAEDLLLEARALAKRNSAPGPDAVPYEVPGLIGEETAGVMATAPTDWCADMGTQDTPQIWAQSILSLIPKSGKGVKIHNLRPIGARVGGAENRCGLHYAQDANRYPSGIGERLRKSPRQQCRIGAHALASHYRKVAWVGGRTFTSSKSISRMPLDVFSTTTHGRR